MVLEHIKYHTHHCGGELRFSHYEDKGFGHNKSMYKCMRCGDLVNIISMPSYDDMHKYRG